MLQQKVAKLEMIRHEFLSGSYSMQRVIYLDQIEVTVDFPKETYEIK